MEDEWILCKSCNRRTYNDYYGFCSSSCLADFACKNGLTFDETKYSQADFVIEDLEDKICNLNSEIDYYQEEASQRYYYEEKCEELEKDNDILIECQHAEKALEAHKEMEKARHQLWIEQNTVSELRDRVSRLEKICRELREKNRLLDNKYTRFEMLDF